MSKTKVILKIKQCESYDRGNLLSQEPEGQESRHAVDDPITPNCPESSRHTWSNMASPSQSIFEYTDPA